MAYILAVSHEDYLRGAIKFDTFEEAKKKWEEEPWKYICDEEGETVFPKVNQFPIGKRDDIVIEITKDTQIYKADNLTKPVEDVILKEGSRINGEIFFGHNNIAFPYDDKGLCYISKKYAKVV